MIGPHGSQLMKAADITPPGRILQGNGLWLYTAYEKKHAIAFAVPLCSLKSLNSRVRPLLSSFPEKHPHKHLLFQRHDQQHLCGKPSQAGSRPQTAGTVRRARPHVGRFCGAPKNGLRQTTRRRNGRLFFRLALTGSTRCL
jgi:hypothetical protein